MTDRAVREFRMLSVEIRQVRTAQAGDLGLKDDFTRLAGWRGGDVQCRLRDLDQLDAMLRREITGQQDKSPRKLTNRGRQSSSPAMLPAMAEQAWTLTPCNTIVPVATCLCG